MALLEINRNPTRRELMWFGAIFMLFFALIGAIAWWKFGAEKTAWVIWIVAASITLVFYLIPAARRAIYLGWMYAAFPLGCTISTLFMAAVFYGLFTGIGLVMRLCRYDPMQRRFEERASTYWVEHRPAGRASRYFRQY